MKRFISLFMIMIIAVGALIGCGSKSVKPPLTAEYCIGKNYSLVESSFHGAGFINVSKIALEDLELNESSKADIIKQVYIDGKSTYTTVDAFSPTSMVVIEYHSIKTIHAPISSNDAKNKDVGDIFQMFKDIGFNDVTTKDVYDLDPDIFDAEFENETLINDVSIFDTNDKFPMNANISIIRHLPYKKYTVQMHIDFIENLIFNKYNVNLLLDEQKQHTLEHGVDMDYNFRLTEGKHTFVFENVNSSSVIGQATIDVKSDIDAAYKISCHSDKITVQTIYLDAKTTLVENEAKMMSSEIEFIGTNYSSVVASIKELGFTNIKEVPVYDIIFGITQPGSTKSVYIGGTNNYKRGDVFSNDVEIIVTYSLRYDEDPANKTIELETSNSQTYKTEKYANISFSIPSTWDSKLVENERMLYFPAVKEITGFIQCSFNKSKIGSVNQAEAKLLLEGAIDGLVDMLQEKAGDTQVRSTDYLKYGNQYAVRVCCYSNISDNEINDDTQMVTDTVVILFADGFTELSALFTPTEYEGTYKGEIEKVLSSITVIDDVSTPASELSDEDKKAIDLAASEIIVGLVINDINDLLKEEVITGYSINQKTGFVNFNMSSDLILMSEDERQVWLDAINNALYSQIAGADVPYTRFRYFVGGTVIAENKMFDPYSVKLQ